MLNLCVRCKGRGYCGKPCKILAKFQLLGKPKTHFSGSSPPEVFVGRFNYPDINTGILAPEEYGETEEYSMPELWHENNFDIETILKLRSRLIYARFRSNIKSGSRFLNIMQEVSMAEKNTALEIVLKKPPRQNIDLDTHSTIIGNPAPLKYARLEENPKISKKVDYLTNDTDVKAALAITELYKSGTRVSNIIKILSAGLLGKQTTRKLVPTRWSITATDDTISKLLLSKIRYYSELQEIQLFHGYYVGNHYEFLLLPDKFSFEVLEAYLQGSVWNKVSGISLSQDYESFRGRKTYASSVTGAYYTARLALCEYLEKIKKQASCLVMREERPEYYAPLGVGILRELSRSAFSKKPETFNTIEEALLASGKRLKLPTTAFTEKSWLLKNYGKQKRLNNWF